MKFETHTYPLTILERHLDSFGHVNNAAYLEIFEEARWDLITRKNYGLDKVQQTKIGPTILEVNLRFHREVKLRQNIVIHTRTENYEGKVGVIIQEMKDESGQLHCTATLKMGLFDLQARKLIPATPEWLHAVGLIS
ncbi:MAG TPA: acyl-CoA thioesterase [Oligoflexia bacterium]|nr:acyl-CoA thioesterase [Oligoflexia bacterium]